jgi:peptidoglycan-associated lipoprotein
MEHTMSIAKPALLTLVAATLLAVACGGKKPPVARPLPPPPPPPVASAAPPPTTARPPAPPQPSREPTTVPPEPIRDDAIASATLDELNRNSPLRPVFFALDSAEIDTEGKAALDADAPLLKRYPAWTVTIEGHCDERGTAEYNLGLGERRAAAARAYLTSLGIPADRLKTVSYGKEFPFDPGHDEGAWAKNRRAHFVITAK